MSLDQFGRQIEYLRISVTDKCNFRCVYCMPEQGLEWLPKSEILSYEEIHGIVARLSELGVSRVRITGGEPTIRPDIDRLIAKLRSISTIRDIALSTNGVRLPQLASRLKQSGLDRVNISVDSLRPDRSAAIARRNLPFNPVHAATSAESLSRSFNHERMRGSPKSSSVFARLPNNRAIGPCSMASPSNLRAAPRRVGRGA